MSTLKEVCSCGATFEYDTGGDRSSYSSSTPAWAAKEWRKGHRHEWPPPQPAPLMVPSDDGKPFTVTSSIAADEPGPEQETQ